MKEIFWEVRGWPPPPQTPPPPKFTIPQTGFPPLGLLYHVSKMCKNVLLQKVQNKKNAKFYGREYFMCLQ